jgi:hypothetical protein
MAATSERRDNGQWGHQADPGAGGHKASRRVSHQIPEIEWQGTVESQSRPKKRRDYWQLMCQCCSCRSTNHFWRTVSTNRMKKMANTGCKTTNTQRTTRSRWEGINGNRCKQMNEPCEMKGSWEEWENAGISILYPPLGPTFNTMAERANSSLLA